MVSSKTKKKPRRQRGSVPRRARKGVGASFADLVGLQARLRAPGGCPWDREQTHQTLRTFLLEESHEVLEAIEKGDFEKLREELGDLLLQVVFHAQLAKEEGRFDIADVTRGIHRKLVRRHPHVFGGVKAPTARHVLKHWEQLKVAERNQAEKNQKAAKRAESLLDGIPQTLPALLEAYQLTRRAANIGFDWDDLAGILEKVKEEAREVTEAAAAKSPRLEEEVGDLLFVAVNMARFLGIDPEIALKKANRKFQARFREMEKHMQRRGRKLADASRQEMEDLWNRSKANA